MGLVGYILENGEAIRDPVAQFKSNM